MAAIMFPNQLPLPWSPSPTSSHHLDVGQRFRNRAQTVVAGPQRHAQNTASSSFFFPTFSPANVSTQPPPSQFAPSTPSFPQSHPSPFPSSGIAPSTFNSPSFATASPPVFSSASAAGFPLPQTHSSPSVSSASALPLPTLASSQKRKRTFGQTENVSSSSSSSSSTSSREFSLGKRTLFQANNATVQPNNASTSIGIRVGSDTKRTKTLLECAVEALSSSRMEESGRSLKKPCNGLSNSVAIEHDLGDQLVDGYLDTEAVLKEENNVTPVSSALALVPFSRKLAFKSNVGPISDNPAPWFSENGEHCAFTSLLPHASTSSVFAPFTADTCFCLLNPDGRIIEGDSKLGRLLRAEPSSLCGKLLLEFILREEWAKAHGTVERLMHNLQEVKGDHNFVSQSFSHRLRDSTGSTFDICGRLYAFRLKGEPLIVCKLVPIPQHSNNAVILPISQPTKRTPVPSSQLHNKTVEGDCDIVSASSLPQDGSMSPPVNSANVFSDEDVSMAAVG